MSLALANPAARRQASPVMQPMPTLPFLAPMRPRNVPEGGLKYWLALSAASVLGCNTGDLFAGAFGFLDGLPLLAAGLGAALWMEKRASRPTQAFYWAAIILVRTAATNLADFTGQTLGMGTFAVLAALLGLTFLKREGAMRGQNALPSVGAMYWLRMLIAGTLGTALGEFSSFASGLGPQIASLTLFGGVAALLLARRFGMLGATLSFWATVIAIRAAGTSLGDLAARDIGLASSVAFAAIVLLGVAFFKAPKPAPDFAARAALA